jgi:geranylgeranyl diphosphate synthase type II
MYSYTQCLEIIEKKISQLQLNQQPVELFEPIQYTLDMGGKRIRPCLALMVHLLFSDNPEEVLEPAIGIEVFHNFTLLHDDIMDNASLRRNQQTVHMKWNQNTAILSGDAMLILAYHLIAKAPASILPRIVELFNRTALEVCEGQQLDMNYEKQSLISEKQYLEMVRLKTAVLLAASMALGGITGKAYDTDIAKLYEAGICAGIGFQLQDDYFDVFSKENSFGKSIGGDIIANKKTFLLISALNSSDIDQVGSLKEWIQKKEFDATEKIREVTELYLKLGVDVRSRELTDEYFGKALDLLDQLHAENAQVGELKKFILSIKQRER